MDTPAWLYLHTDTLVWLHLHTKAHRTLLTHVCAHITPCRHTCTHGARTQGIPAASLAAESVACLVLGSRPCPFQPWSTWKRTHYLPIGLQVPSTSCSALTSPLCWVPMQKPSGKEAQPCPRGSHHDRGHVSGEPAAGATPPCHPEETLVLAWSPLETSAPTHLCLSCAPSHTAKPHSQNGV